MSLPNAWRCHRDLVVALGARDPEELIASAASPRIFLNYLLGKYPGVTMRQFRYCRSHRFYPERALEYDFITYKPEDYFPTPAIGSPGATLDPAETVCCLDKVVFAFHMREIGANTPESLPNMPAAGSYSTATKPTTSNRCCSGHGELIIKPRGNVGGGVGVRVVRPGDATPRRTPARSRRRASYSTPTRPRSVPTPPTPSGS